MKNKRDELLRLLEAHTPEDSNEQESLRFITDFVRERPDPFTRRNFDAHVTSSAIVLHPTERSTLLVWHTKLQRWLQPGGHVEGDDTSVYESARREALEETGYAALDRGYAQILDVDVHPIPGRGAESPHKHLDIRFVFTAGEVVGTADHDVRWVNEADIPSLNLDHSATRALKKAFGL